VVEIFWGGGWMGRLIRRRPLIRGVDSLSMSPARRRVAAVAVAVAVPVQIIAAARNGWAL
jgi:hypothetical protein